MRATHVSVLRLLAISLILTACKGSDSTTGTNSNNNQNNTTTCTTTKYTATVNGTAWCAVSTAANYYAAQQQVVITGSGLISTVAWNITLSVSSITAAGTYNLKSLAPLRFSLVSNSNGASYSSNNTGGSGTITFTTFTTTHVVGTFTITAPVTSGGTGTATVAGGSFDVTLTPG